MTVKRALLIYAAVFLLALPLTFPANLLSRFIELPPGVSHSPLKGTLLSVKLDWVELQGVRLRELSAGPSLLGLLSGTPLRFSAVQPFELGGRVGASENTVKLDAVSASARFEVVRSLLGIPGLGLDTLIDLQVSEATLAGQRCESLNGVVELSDFQGEDFAQLSTLTGNLSCENGQVLISVEPDNALRLAGSATVMPNGRYQVAMTAEPPPGPLFELFVDFLGQPRDGRRFQIRFRS